MLTQFFFKISLAITGMNAVCPVFFKLISMMEQYHPRVALYWELTRYYAFAFLFLSLISGLHIGYFGGQKQ